MIARSPIKKQIVPKRMKLGELLIMKGKIYIYAIRHPERCTLEIGRGPSGFWSRKQLKGFQNRKPKRTTVKAVDAWLARQSLSV